MKNKTILISGISKGVGKELSIILSKDNKIIGLSRSNYIPQKSNISHFQCDLTQPKEIKHVLHEIISSCGTIDILINNASFLSTHPLLLISDDDIKNMVLTNLLGTIILTKYVFRNMIKNNYGRIINITSIAPKISEVGDSVYAATKAGVESFSKIINKEGINFNVLVNNLGISAIKTGMLEQIVKNNPESILKIIPHKKFATIESIIHIIEFLCAENNKDIGGQTIYLGGIS